MATWKAIPEDITSRLTRLNAEITRRNGYSNISSNAPIALPVGTPITAGGYIVADAINTIFSGLRIINSVNVPSDVVAEETRINKSDLNAIDSLLLLFESQPRAAVSGNDCGSACVGMCVTQCTTTCLSTCTGGCTSTCSNTCTGGCTNACTSCTGTCSGGCSGCTGGCTGSCTAACSDGCGSWCSTNCMGTCVTYCASHCSSNCSGTCSVVCGSLSG